MLVKAAKFLLDPFKIGILGKLVILLITCLVALFAWLGLWWVIFPDNSTPEERIFQYLEQQFIEDCAEFKNDPEDEKYRDMECNRIERLTQYFGQQLIEECAEFKNDPEDERYEDGECDEIEKAMDEESEPGKNKLLISGIFGVAIIASLVSLVLIMHLLDVLIGIIVFAMSSLASYFLIRFVLGIFVEITSTMTTITLIFSIIFGVILGLVSHMFVFDWIASKTKLSIFIKFRY